MLVMFRAVIPKRVKPQTGSRFPLAPQQTCHLRGMFPDQIYRLVAHKKMADMVQSAVGEGGLFPLCIT